MNKCFACSSDIRNAKKKCTYVICPECGHGHGSVDQLCGILVNERLNYSRAVYFDRLTREQIKLVKEVAVRTNYLIDVGSGTGKFLYHSANYFKNVFGLEVDKHSLQFAKELLALNVSENIANAPSPYDVITSWHALEHIPGAELITLLNDLHTRSYQKTRYIVCVPNPQSFVAKFSGPKWAFRDVDSHLHEFTNKSLNLIHTNAGFKLLGSRKILSYNIFSWVQSLANLSPLPHNYIYYRTKRGWTYGMSPIKLLIHDIMSTLFLIPAIIVGTLGGLYEHIWANEKSVHLFIYGIDRSDEH